MITDKLQQDKELLERQLNWIKISWDECKLIGIKPKEN